MRLSLSKRPIRRGTHDDHEGLGLQVFRAGQIGVGDEDLRAAVREAVA